ncbi:MAG: hypothetical protein V1871_08405 [Planctomycetota bacterium]
MEHLIEPDFTLHTFKMWVHDRGDNLDSNWIIVTAECSASGAIVRVENRSIIELFDIEKWMKDMKQMHQTLKGEAILSPCEPEVYAKLTMKNHGLMDFEVEITPDNLYQMHKFIFELNQSYLPSAISDLDKILKKYPIVGKH